MSWSIFWNLESLNFFKISAFQWLTLFLLLVACYYLFISKSESNYPPGPRGYPILGFLPSLLHNQAHEVLDQFAKKYGEIFSIKVAGKRYVVLNSYEAIREAYVENGTNFSDRSQDFTVLGKFFEFKAMPFVNGEEWRAHRKILSTWIKAGNNQENLEARVAEAARDFKEKIRALNSKAVDMYPIFSRAAMDIIGSLICGERLVTTQPEVAESLLTDIRRVFQFIPTGEIVFNGRIVELIFNLFSKKRREFEKIQGQLFSLMDRFIQEHQETRQSNLSRDYVDAFLSAQETATRNKTWFDRRSLVVNMLAFFVAGIDTSSSSLYFATCMMAKHPEIQARCQEEIDANVGRRPIDYSDRRRLPYVEATLNEVFRRAGVGGVPQVRSNHARTNFRGWDIPVNTTFITNIWTATHDPKYFQNPNNFDPDNFFEKDIPRELSSLPFSAGKRNCPAEKLARLDVFMIFTSLLQDFTITFPPEFDMENGSEKFLPGFNRVLAPFKIIANPR